MPLLLRPALPLLALFLATVPVLAQREGNGRPTQDPFARQQSQGSTRGMGSYRSHRYQRGILTISTTTGGTLRLSFKISMFYTLRVNQGVEYTFIGKKSEKTGGDDYAGAYA